MKKLLSAGVLAGLLSLGTITLCAQEHGQDTRTSENRTYTDSDHVRHEWNQKEEDAWKRYREERHIKQEEFAKASRKQQDAYWKWRHEHPDER